MGIKGKCTRGLGSGEHFKETKGDRRIKNGLSEYEWKHERK
jgi:hypothetical protein